MGGNSSTTSSETRGDGTQIPPVQKPETMELKIQTASQKQDGKVLKYNQFRNQRRRNSKYSHFRNQRKKGSSANQRQNDSSKTSSETRQTSKQKQTEIWFRRRAEEIK